MSVDIVLSDHERIINDDHQWIMQRTTSGAKWVNVGYYPTLAQLLHALLERRYKASTAQTLGELLEDVRTASDSLSQLLRARLTLQ